MIRLWYAPGWCELKLKGAPTISSASGVPRIPGLPSTKKISCTFWFFFFPLESCDIGFTSTIWDLLNLSLPEFPWAVRAWELGIARRVRKPHPASACSFSTLRLNLVLTHGIPPDFRGGVHLFIPPYAIGPVPSLSGHAFSYRWRSLPRVRRHRASSPQVPVTGACCFCRSPWTNQCTPLFSHTHYYWYEVVILLVILYHVEKYRRQNYCWWTVIGRWKLLLIAFFILISCEDKNGYLEKSCWKIDYHKSRFLSWKIDYHESRFLIIFLTA